MNMNRIQMQKQYYSKANLIKQKHGPAWQRDLDLIEKEKSNYNRNLRELKKAETEDPAYWQGKFKSINFDPLKFNGQIPRSHIVSSQTLVVFAWDCISPFFNEAFDAENNSFKKFKEILELDNNESSSLEKSRSDHVFTPNFGSRKTPILNEELYYVPGTSKLMHNRFYCHVGLIIDKAQHTKDITTSHLDQACLEAHEAAGCVRDAKKYLLVSKDTSYNRMIKGKEAIDEILFKLMQYQMIMANMHYQQVYFVINPALPADHESVKNLKLIMEVRLRMLIKNWKEKNTESIHLPNFTIIILDNIVGFECNAFFNGTMHTALRSDEMVGNHNFI